MDDYSRMPVYLKASDNNRAETVLQEFVKGVEEFGLPSRVRSDKGGENVEENGILSREDDAHIWCLHYVFLPIINEHLCNWKDAWIHHPIRTENNKTPFQLWVTGLEHARTTGANRIIEPLQVGTSAERNFRPLAIPPILLKLNVSPENTREINLCAKHLVCNHIALTTYLHIHCPLVSLMGEIG